MAPDPNWPTVIPITEATIEYMTPDTTTTSRADFTEFFQRFECAPDAHPAYRHLFLTHQKLAKLCAAHPAMRPNLEQTFSTPANSKNKVYFMWDFVLRTFQHICAAISAQLPRRCEMWEEVVGRASMAKYSFLDTKGKVEAMNASVGYRDDAGVDFGDEIRALAETLEDLPKGCHGCGKGESKDGGKLLACARCKESFYCSTECQKSCWKMHKKECVPT